MTERQIELLAPARDPDAGRIAVDYGADALYIGGERFGARAAAGNGAQDTARLVEYARRFGVRVYAALNTLIYEHELEEAERIARELIEAGVDALIVQDPAFLRMGLQGVEFHASTQMQNVAPEKVRFLEKCGFSRIILERGLTLRQIEAIRSACDVELEVFVHGAICVGHSGRCYMSRSLGMRSGNRGECAQPCRLSYDLEDGAGRKILRNKHLLSLRDLELAGRIPELLAAGVNSFKIEGRLKETSYVKNTVAFYRREIDAAMGSGMARSSRGRTATDFEPDLSRTFTRGASEYYLMGKTRGAASFDTPKSIGNRIGAVSQLYRDSFTTQPAAELSPGDGICFLAPDGELRGTNVNRADEGRIYPNRMEGIAPGTEIFRNYDHRFTATLAASRTRRIMDVKASLRFSDGELKLTLSGEKGVSACAAVKTTGEAVRDAERFVSTIRGQISKSGGMPFRVTETVVTGRAEFAPISALNALRRLAMERLLEAFSELPPVRDLRTEDRSFPYPSPVDGYHNVTNSLAERFYRDHGAREVSPGHDLSADLTGVEVMRTPYCIRRETGRCLKDGGSLPVPLPGPLLLTRGERRWRLEFDCENCEMKIIPL